MTWQAKSAPNNTNCAGSVPPDGNGQQSDNAAMQRQNIPAPRLGLKGRRPKHSPEVEAQIRREFALGRENTTKKIRARHGISSVTLLAIVRRTAKRHRVAK